MNAPDVPKKKLPKDRTLFASVVRAHKANAIIISVNAARLNYPGSPVWDPGENAGPIVAMFSISIALMFAVSIVVGVAMTVLSAIVFTFIVRPWILQRVSGRALDAAMDNLHNWELLWKKGGLGITLTVNHSARCQSSAGDWRAFVVRHLPIINVEEDNTIPTTRLEGDAVMPETNNMEM